MDKLKKYLLTETGQSIAVIVILLLCVWIFGCQSKVRSLNGSLDEVTRVELKNELDHLLTVAESRFLELDRQDEIKQMIFNSALMMARGGSINPIGVMTTFGAILGLGATVDNVKKRKEIKKLST